MRAKQIAHRPGVHTSHRRLVNTTRRVPAPPPSPSSEESEVEPDHSKVPTDPKVLQGYAVPFNLPLIVSPPSVQSSYRGSATGRGQIGAHRVRATRAPRRARGHRYRPGTGMLHANLFALRVLQKITRVQQPYLFTCKHVYITRSFNFIVFSNVFVVLICASTCVFVCVYHFFIVFL